MTTPSLADLARDLRAGRTTATALTEAALAAARLDAYRTRDPARTRAVAAAADAALAAGADLGPLQGIPTSVKDLYGVPGWPTHAGTARRLPAGFEAAGPVVAALCAQLAPVAGKTHTVELAFGGIGTNPHAGTPVNPWDAARHRVPGGSSAGAGVSLQEGSAHLALGTDTAGSVRIPAAWTATVGLKTTAGRWSTAGIVPLSPTLDTAGILARTVADAAFAFAALGHADPVPEPVDLGRVRVGRVASVFWDGLSPGVGEAVEAALGELPWRPADVALPVDEALALFRAGGPVAAELDAFLEHALPDVRPGLDPNVAARVADAGTLPVREYLLRRHQLRDLALRAAAAFEHADVIVAPTVANTPPPVADVADPAAYRAQNGLCLRNTAVVSYLGLCAISLPCGLDAEGMPVGLQLVAAPHREEQLLGVALAVERALGTADQRLGRPPR
ncbi:MAG: amidase [Myxococcota bacterium]